MKANPLGGSYNAPSGQAPIMTLHSTLFLVTKGTSLGPLAPHIQIIEYLLLHESSTSTSQSHAQDVGWAPVCNYRHLLNLTSWVRA